MSSGLLIRSPWNIFGFQNGVRFRDTLQSGLEHRISSATGKCCDLGNENWAFEYTFLMNSQITLWTWGIGTRESITIAVDVMVKRNTLWHNQTCRCCYQTGCSSHSAQWLAIGLRTMPYSLHTHTHTCHSTLLSIVITARRERGLEKIPDLFTISPILDLVIRKIQQFYSLSWSRYKRCNRWISQSTIKMMMEITT